MIKNYFKTALRNLQKNKGFTLINILGLSIGLAACLLIVFYVVDELSYDRYNSNAGRIYRINEDLKLGNNRVAYAACMAPLAQTLKNDFADVEDAVRLKRAGSIHIKKGNETLLEYNTAFADPTLFHIFTLPMLYGNPATALKEPNSVVITAATAIKYFNRLNVTGQFLTIDNNTRLKVTGIIKDIPRQSHFNFDFFISMASYPDSRLKEWLRSDYNTYVLLRKGAYYKNLEAQFPQFLRKYSSGQMQSELNMSLDSFERNGSFFRLNMMPLTAIHLHSDMSAELGTNSTVQYVYIFSIIALFILLLACVNFMNLSTARSADRSREVGVRKVLGSTRKQLIVQFLLESTLVTLGATLIALVVSWAVLPLFNQLSGKSLSITWHTLTWLMPSAAFAVIIIGFIAGSYPAFFLSGFQPVQVLKGKLSTGFKEGRLRSYLVVFQFSISIFLIIGTLVVYSQLHYIQNRNVGYNRNQVLIVKNAYELGSHAQTFKQEARQLPGVSNATLSGYLPTSANRSTAIFYKNATMDARQSIFPQTWVVDEDYINTLGMKMAAGRNFSSQMPTDSSGLVINETAARFLEISNPVGKTLYRSLGGPKPVLKPYHILGIVKDFNFNSLRESITPVIMTLNTDAGNLSIRVQTQNLQAILSQLEHQWKALSPTPFQYSFMDADFEAAYRSEQQTGQIFVVFTLLAIVIACLGLFGLAAYAAEQRNKEIGIRKVLGASIADIIAMLSKDFIALVLIAIVIALPLAWLIMQKWLQGFAYRDNIKLWVLIVSALGTIVIAWATVTFQALKAALINPVKTLKGE